ncbi:MAG: hypothetical protein MUF53_05015 [Gemmatimonadaceae bacterium]|nr:hypothetical protein [Gemmatimonadaceae bacterium]
MALLGAGRRREAQAAFAALATRWPAVERFATTAAVLSAEVDGPARAMPRLRETVQRFPASATAWAALGNAAAAVGDLFGARDALTRAVACDAADARLWFSLGRVALLAGDAPAADAAFVQALARDARHGAAMAGRAAAANWLGRWSDGEALARAALALDASDADAALNLSVALLAQQRWADGWTHYDARWRTTHAIGARRDWPGRRWRGEAAGGETGSGDILLVHAEQGFGDTLQFVRFLPALRRPGRTVVLAAQPALVRYLQGSGLADAVVPMDAPPPDATWHVPLLSVPSYVDMAGDVSLGRAYLPRPPVARRDPSAPLRFGLVWAGSPTHANDARRSIALDTLAPLLHLPGTTWQSLQQGPRADELARAGLPLAPMPPVADFADTARLVATCDVVVSVDTAVAHLAAGMGVPTWILVPAAGRDWRWASAAHGRTPWYESARVVPQAHDGDWTTPIARLHDVLHDALQVVRQRRSPSALEARGVA